MGESEAVKAICRLDCCGVCREKERTAAVVLKQRDTPLEEGALPLKSSNREALRLLKNLRKS